MRTNADSGNYLGLPGDRLGRDDANHSQEVTQRDHLAELTNRKERVEWELHALD